MRRGLKIFCALGALALGLRTAGAADPVHYTVTFTASGDPVLDGLIRQTSVLALLQKKLPPAPFALIGRARADDAQLLIVLHSLGYDGGSVDIRIAGRPVDDVNLLDFLSGAPAEVPVPVLVTPHRGALYHLGSVTFDGLPAGFMPPAMVKPGDVARAAPVLDETGALRTALHNAGFAFATVEAPAAYADAANNRLDVSYRLVAGPRVNIGAIDFAGLTRTDPAFLRRHMALRPGQRFSDSALAGARDSLLGLGVFSSVTPVPASGQAPPGAVPILFRLSEQKRHAVTIGAAYATDTGVTISTSWEDRNVFRHAETLTVTAAANGLGGTGTTSPGYDLKGVFAKPDTLSVGQTLSISLEGLREFLTAYDRTALLAGAQLARPLGHHVSLSYGPAFVTERVDQEGVSRSYVLAQFPVTLSYDTTDSVFEPTHGIRASFALTPTRPISGGGGGFLIAQASGATFLPVEPEARGIIALRALVGTIQGATQFQVPPDQRFYAGGSGTVRGFTYQTIGPLFADDNPEGGTAIDAGTVEFRQRIGKSFGIVPFVDAGQVAAGAKPFTGTVRVGAGIGARYYTGIGPIRFDVAVPLNRTAGSGSFAIYIGLGEAF